MDVESGQQCHKKSSCVPIRRSVQCEITKYSWSNGSQLLWLRPKSKAKTSNNVGMEKAAASLFEALGCTRMVQRSLCVCVFFCSHTFLCLQGPCQPGCFLQVPFRNQSAGKNPFYLSVSSWKNQMAKNVLMSIRWQSSLASQQGQNFGFSLILVCLVWQGSWSLSLRHVRRNLHAVCSGKPNCRDVLRKVCRHHPISLG